MIGFWDALKHASDYLNEIGPGMLSTNQPYAFVLPGPGGKPRHRIDIEIKGWYPYQKPAPRGAP